MLRENEKSLFSSFHICECIIFHLHIVTITLCNYSPGIAVGHLYYVLEDVFPQRQGGFRILATPNFMWVCVYVLIRSKGPYSGVTVTIEHRILLIWRVFVESLW